PPSGVSKCEVRTANALAGRASNGYLTISGPSELAAFVPVTPFAPTCPGRTNMTQDVGRSFSGTRLEDADFSGARLHAPNFQGTRITDAWLRDADVSGDIIGMRVNGVEIAPLVEAELDRRFPERRALRATDPQGLREAWAMIEELWASTLGQARGLEEPLLHERVDGEWSFVETLRHLIFATDCWLNVM